MAIDVGLVAMVRVEDIEIGERAREEMGDLAGLEDSMKQLGMAQPICVRENDGEKPYLLLGGARRLGILIKNNNEEVPVRIYPYDISPLEEKSIELAENFFRKDFEYWEYDNLVAEIDSMQREIHGSKISTAKDAEGWTMQNTAEMMGISKPQVSQAVKRAEAREAFPELFTGCKTASDASKVLSKVNEAIVREAIAKKIEAQQANGKVNSISKGFIVGDFFEGVKKIPDSSIHLVEIDPPYGIDLTDMKRKDGISKYDLESYNEVPRDIFMDGHPERSWKGLNTVFSECYRVMTDHSWLICWFAPEPWFGKVYNALLNAGFSTTRMVGIWTKGTPGKSMNPSTRLANCYEMFFWAWKGQPALASPGHGNEFRHSPVPPQRKTHPTERPTELMTELYQTFAWTGSRILIPFLGSGNGLFAAKDLGMEALGFELSKTYRDSFLVKAHAKYGSV